MSQSESVSEEISPPGQRRPASVSPAWPFRPTAPHLPGHVDGNIKVFGVKGSGRIVGLFSIPLPPATRRGVEPKFRPGLLVSPDGKRLLRGAQSFQPAGRAGCRHWPRAPLLGCRRGAPSAWTLAGQKVYVSNWGARRRPDAECVNPAPPVSARSCAWTRADTSRLRALFRSLTSVRRNGSPKSEVRSPKS